MECSHFCYNKEFTECRHHGFSPPHKSRTTNFSYSVAMRLNFYIIIYIPHSHIPSHSHATLFPPTLVMISSAVQMACILYPFPIFLCFELHPHQSPEHAEFFSVPHLKPSVSAVRGQPLSKLRLCSSVSHTPSQAP